MTFFACLVISRHIKTGGNFHLLFKGTPEIREHYLDSKKDVDRHLKSACEQFIQQQTRLFIETLEEFLTKVQTLLHAWESNFEFFPRLQFELPSCEILGRRK